MGKSKHYELLLPKNLDESKIPVEFQYNTEDGMPSYTHNIFKPSSITTVKNKEYSSYKRFDNKELFETNLDIYKKVLSNFVSNGYKKRGYKKFFRYKNFLLSNKK